MLAISRWILCFALIFCFEQFASAEEKYNNYDVNSPSDVSTENSINQTLIKGDIEHAPCPTFKIDKRDQLGLSGTTDSSVDSIDNLKLRLSANTKTRSKQEGRGRQGILVEIGSDTSPVKETPQHLVTRINTPTQTRTVTRKTWVPGGTTTSTQYDPPLLSRGGGDTDWAADIPGSTTYVTSPGKYETYYKEQPILESILNGAQKDPNQQPLTWVKTSETTGQPGKWIEETTQSGQPSSWQKTAETRLPGKWVEETKVSGGNSDGEEDEDEEEKGNPSTYFEESSSSGGSPPAGRGNSKQIVGGGNSSSSSSSRNSWSKESGKTGSTSKPSRGPLLAIKRERKVTIHGKKASKSAARRNSRTSSMKRSASAKRSAAHSRSVSRSSRSKSRSRSYSPRGRRSP